MVTAAAPTDRAAPDRGVPGLPGADVAAQQPQVRRGGRGQRDRLEAVAEERPGHHEHGADPECGEGRRTQRHGERVQDQRDQASPSDHQEQELGQRFRRSPLLVDRQHRLLQVLAPTDERRGRGDEAEESGAVPEGRRHDRGRLQQEEQRNDAARHSEVSQGGPGDEHQSRRRHEGQPPSEALDEP